jgi:hypothetical protein
LVVRHKGICWLGVAAAVGESEKGGYDAEEEIVDVHVGGWELEVVVDSGVRGLTKGLELDNGVAEV